jgi:hypothetical protein
MMEIKLLEVRDRGTFMPVLCVNTARADNEGQRYLLQRCGYPLDGRPNIIMMRLSADGDSATNDPYWWPVGNRTLRVAHRHIIEHWDELKDGDVVCVEWILGERTEPQRSERECAL